MASRLRYSDAVKLLGGSSPAVQAIDNLLGSALSVATLGGSDTALDFFDAKAEMVRLGRIAAGRLQDAVRGQGRYDRNLRLEAAHAILVVTAFFEALDEIVGAAEFPRPEVTRDDQVMLAAGAPFQGNWLDALLSSALPVPSPETTYDALLAELTGWYGVAGEWFASYLIGLAEWDRADDRARRAVGVLLQERLPRRAVAHYEQAHRRLAVDVPEFAVWVDRAESRAVGRGLVGLETTLRRIVSGQDPTRHRAALAAAYRAELDRPILGRGDGGELTIPRLGEAYVDARFQVKGYGPGSRPADVEWWDTESRGDLSGFLARYLLAPWATIAPMLLLGHPGAGKSALTRVLAARLPAADFLAVRVVLREVPAEAEIQDQIEYALRQAIGETVAWADLARSADGALPVVMLDGFDELLQATGVHQSDYLRRVAEFQRREAVQGRPVAVIVTSRVAVADRARLPDDGLVVRLEPFDDEQIERWLTTWDTANRGALAARGLKPLPFEVARRFPDLARQPLLLLMLALYDATENALQATDSSFGTVQLYERLLGDFARREVRRWYGDAPDRELDELVEDELMRLSIVAFAMFNRGRQWVTEDELNADLGALGVAPTRVRQTEAFRSPLTLGQEVVGRFFFIQRAQATQDDRILQTYEFLHATFGEFLVARVIVNLLRENAARAASPMSRLRATSGDDELLRSLLWHMSLSVRQNVLAYVAELLDGPHRKSIRSWLLDTFRSVVHRSEYAPRTDTGDQRVALYSLNLALLILTCGEGLRAGEIWPDEEDPSLLMRMVGQSWRSSIPAGYWLDEMAPLTVRRTWSDRRRDIELMLATESAPPSTVDPLWTRRIPPDHHIATTAGATFDLPVEMDRAMKSMDLTTNMSEDVLRHAAEPFIERVPSALTRFVSHGDGRSESLAHSLVDLLLAPFADDEAELVDAYDRAVLAVCAWLPEHFTDRTAEQAMVCRILLDLLERDKDRVPTERLDDYLARLR